MASAGTRNNQEGSSSRMRRGGALAPNEYYQALLRRICEYDLDDPPRLVGLVSGALGEGVTTIAANLAVQGVGAGIERVLLVDFNFAQPGLAPIFRCHKSPGLAQALDDTKPLPECVQRTSYEQLYLLSAGTKGGRHTGPAFRPERLKEMLKMMREEFDFVVFDLPPAMDPSISLTVAGMLDGVLLVVEAQRNRPNELQQIKKQLIRAKANLLGVVLNKRRK